MGAADVCRLAGGSTGGGGAADRSLDRQAAGYAAAVIPRVAVTSLTAKILVT